MSHNQQPLREGIESAKVGRKLMARMQLEQVLEANPQDADAWLWLGWTADSPEQAIGYLTTALRLRPGDELARRYLQVATDFRDFEPSSDGTHRAELSEGDHLDFSAVASAAFDSDAACEDREPVDSSETSEALVVAEPLESGELAACGDRADAFEFGDDLDLVPLSEEFESPVIGEDIDRFAQGDLPEPPEPFDAEIELDEWKFSEPLESFEPFAVAELAGPVTPSAESFRSNDEGEAQEEVGEEIVEAVEVVQVELEELEELEEVIDALDITDFPPPADEAKSVEEVDTAIKYAMSVVEEEVQENEKVASSALSAPTQASDDDLAMLADQMRAHAEAIRREPRPLRTKTVEADHAPIIPTVPPRAEEPVATPKELVEAEDESPAPAEAAGPVLVTEPTVLVVDDSRAVRTLVGLALQSHGYQVLLADSVASAIEVLSATRPSLLLVDDAMPQADGYQLCKWIKSNEALKTMPVILLTGKDGMFDRLRGKLVGCNEHLCKPFETADLLRRVEYHVPVAHAVSASVA